MSEDGIAALINSDNPLVGTLRISNMQRQVLSLRNSYFEKERKTELCSWPNAPRT